MIYYVPDDRVKCKPISDIRHGPNVMHAISLSYDKFMYAKPCVNYFIFKT